MFTAMGEVSSKRDILNHFDNLMHNLENIGIMQRNTSTDSQKFTIRYAGGGEKKSFIN